MTLKEFLKKYDIINKTGLAAAMWPGVARPAVKINQKLKEARSGNGRARVLPADAARAKEVLLQMLEDAKSIE